jgi:hypothetical protein
MVTMRRTLKREGWTILHEDDQVIRAFNEAFTVEVWDNPSWTRDVDEGGRPVIGMGIYRPLDE